MQSRKFHCMAQITGTLTAHAVERLIRHPLYFARSLRVILVNCTGSWQKKTRKNLANF